MQFAKLGFSFVLYLMNAAKMGDKCVYLITTFPVLLFIQMVAFYLYFEYE